MSLLQLIDLPLQPRVPPHDGGQIDDVDDPGDRISREKVRVGFHRTLPDVVGSSISERIE